MNLLEETIQDIEESGHEIEDIVFIGSEKTGHRCDWDQFVILADRDYSRGFGAAEVAQDLIIVFSDRNTMTRGEYDGSEWWQYSKPFSEPEESRPINSLFIIKNQIGWKDLAQTNPEEAEAPQ